MDLPCSPAWPWWLRPSATQAQSVARNSTTTLTPCWGTTHASRPCCAYGYWLHCRLLCKEITCFRRPGLLPHCDRSATPREKPHFFATMAQTLDVYAPASPSPSHTHTNSTQPPWHLASLNCACTESFRASLLRAWSYMLLFACALLWSCTHCNWYCSSNFAWLDQQHLVTQISAAATGGCVLSACHCQLLRAARVLHVLSVPVLPFHF